MKLILFLCFLSLTVSGQPTDTIFKKNGKKICCSITLVNEGAIFFKDKTGFGDQVETSKVNFYSLNGVRKEAVPFYSMDFSPYKLDTSRNELGHIKLVRIFQYTDTALNKNALFDRAKAFIYKTYKSGKNVILYDDKLNGELHCEAYTKALDYNGELIKNCNGGHFKYKIAIYTKDQKLKIVIDDITHQKGACPIEAESGSDFGDVYPSTWPKQNARINQYQYTEFKKQTLLEFKHVIDNLEKITSAKNNDGDF